MCAYDKHMEGSGKKKGEVKGFCVRCQHKHTMKNAKASMSKNGRKMMKGECAKCGGKMCLFVKMTKA